MGEGDTGTCQLCWALVPTTMMHFHRDWHARLDRSAELQEIRHLEWQAQSSA